MNSKKVNSVLKGVAVAGATIGGVSSIQGADVVMAAELESNSADSMSSDVASQSESVSDSAVSYTHLDVYKRQLLPLIGIMSSIG